MTRASSKAGLTLLELVVVVAIITVLAGVAIPTLSTYIENQTTDESAERMELLAEAMRHYARDNLRVPDELADLVRPDGSDTWRGPYVTDYIQGWARKDPGYQNDNWGRALDWQAGGRVSGDLRSAGANGVMGDEDDLVLNVDVRPLLREITLERLEVINTAVLAYNSQYQASAPLTGDIDQVVSILVQQGFLPGGQEWTEDAFGDPLQVNGNPVTSVFSPNVLNGSQPGGTGTGPRGAPGSGRPNNPGRSNSPPPGQGGGRGNWIQGGGSGGGGGGQ